jgi:hypothetical protein
MAVIVPGPVVADIRGKVGGVTYSRNQGGLYVKANPDWTQPASGFRDATQDALEFVAKAWSDTLTENQRQSWRIYARAHPRPNRWGHRTLTNGYTFFVRANFYLCVGRETIFYPTAPTLPPPPAPTFTASPSPATNKWSLNIPAITIPPGQDCISYYVYDQLPEPKGQTGTRGPWRYCSYQFSEPPGAAKNTTFAPSWTIAANQHRALKIISQWYPDGAISTPSYVQANT